VIGAGCEPFILKQQRKKVRAVGHYSQAIPITQAESTKKADKKPFFFISTVNNRIKQGFRACRRRPKLKMALCYAPKLNLKETVDE
jgi:hypothetical protein